ncbi:MAG: alpha-ketoglutarate-dependent dioxygenase AlkB [Planctomycetaceae bacterium]|nr:alpha-ketoglutarate-dependent dioxygenase AlkB [Planctomycetaceae bacterium]
MNLFQSRSPIRIEIPDADVLYFEAPDLGVSSREALERLLREVPWEQRTITVWGKAHLQPRLIAWYGDPGTTYSYSRIQLAPRPWTDWLMHLKVAVENAVASRFNSALLNLYRDHRDSMGFHSDDEPELGPHPTIASLSFGAERVFLLKHRAGASGTVRLKLASGSLLLMKGKTQAHWQHGINKQATPCGPRVNVTFRQILQGIQ